MEPSELHSCECSPGEWVTGGLENPPDKGQSLLPGARRGARAEERAAALLSFGAREDLPSPPEMEQKVEVRSVGLGFGCLTASSAPGGHCVSLMETHTCRLLCLATGLATASTSKSTEPGPSLGSALFQD